MMRTTVRFVILWSAILIGLSSQGSAQELNWAEKMFDSLNYDFGFIAHGSEARHQLKVTNLYEQTVHIQSVRSTCGCSVGQPSTNTLQSRETADIDIIFDTRRFTKKKDSSLIITFDAPLYAEVRVPLTAYIRSDVVVNPGSVNFGTLGVGEESQKSVSIAYAGRGDWTIKDVLSNCEHVTASVVEKNRSGGRVDYELSVALKPTAPAGTLREQLTVVTDDANAPYLPLLVEGKIEADISVTPEVVSLGVLSAGETKQVSIVLKGKKPFTIEKLESESGEDGFRATLTQQSRIVQVVPLTLTAPQDPGTFTESFKITIADRPEPLTFKAYGKVAAPTAN